MARLLPTCFLLSFLGLCDAHADAPTALQHDIIGLTQTLMSAIGDGKSEVWQNTLANDAVVVDEFGRIQNKSEAVAAIVPLPKGFSGSIEIRDAHVQLFGNTAVIRYEAYERETVFGQQLVVRYIMVGSYVRQAESWKLAALSEVTLPTPPPRLAVAGIDLNDYPGSYHYGPDRAFNFGVKDGVLGYVTRAGRPFVPVEALARDVFMGTDDEKNILLFRRDSNGHVVELIERRKFNDLHMTRDTEESPESH